MGKRRLGDLNSLFFYHDKACVNAFNFIDQLFSTLPLSAHVLSPTRLGVKERNERLSLPVIVLDLLEGNRDRSYYNTVKANARQTIRLIGRASPRCQDQEKRRVHRRHAFHATE